MLTADAATQAQMPLEPLQPATQAQLREILPGFATVRNPVDITAALLTNSGLFGSILPPISRDPAADAFMIGIAVAGAGYTVEAFARDAANFAQDTGKPVVMAAPQTSIAEQFKAHGLAVYPTEGEAVHSLGQYLTHMQLLAETRAQPPRPPKQPAPVGETHLLDEADSLALLARHGVPVVAHRLCSTEQEAVQAFAQLGAARVVVKGCTDQASHKSELGLVKLGITDAAGVRNAWQAMQAAAARAGISLTGVIVAEQVQGQRELMVGARIDPVFGPVVLVGDGGKYVEAMPDVQVLLAPFSPAKVQAALRQLRIAPLLDGVRGEPALDVQAFCETAVAVGLLMSDPEAGVSQLDINPVMVRARGQGCVALDAGVYQRKA